ncbi:hypothetical protein N3K66_004552 [Trichothecium roseum]|uniref:Uncharacterized protein n=1 Tax=Trichothecium roseum TaxID=47278 RepID=A0ACC0V2Z6_9HYPO|nr:hypothetical protein N3K66_004552 [Trichothecium roseum]
MGSRINKACDGCRFRKVKCNGVRPCSQCAHLNLSCVFSPPAGKRKPGIRGRLVAQLRENPQARAVQQQQQQQQQQLLLQQQTLTQRDETNRSLHGYQSHSSASPTSPQSTSSAPSAASVAGIIHADSDGPVPDCGYGGAGSGSYGGDCGSGTRLRRVGTRECPYPIDFFLRLMPNFENLVFPMNPILTPEEMLASIATMRDSHEDAALVYAWAAATLTLTKTSWDFDTDLSARLTDLLQLSLAAHRTADFSVDPGGLIGELPVSVKRISTCVFLEITMVAFKHVDRGNAILREAISMIQTLRVYQYMKATSPEDISAPAAAAGLDRREIARRQRLYWVAYIHERFAVMMSGYSVSLPPLSTGLPLDDTSIPSSVNLGFRRLILLFRVMDDEFLQHWCRQHHDRAREDIPEMTAQWVERKQAELDLDERDLALDEERHRAAGGEPLNELQHADLFITRLWLRTLVWQLALSRGLLKSAPPDDAHQGMSLHFPAARLSAQLRTLVSRLDSVASIGMHGSGILEKLFEVTSTIADVCALPPGSTGGHEDVRARMEDFVFLVGFLFQFERVPKSVRDYLREKIDVLEGLYMGVNFDAVATSPPGKVVQMA